MKKRKEVIGTIYDSNQNTVTVSICETSPAEPVCVHVAVDSKMGYPDGQKRFSEVVVQADDFLEISKMLTDFVSG